MAPTKTPSTVRRTIARVLLPIAALVIAGGCAGDDPTTRSGVSTNPADPPSPTEELSVPGTTVTFTRPRGGDPTTELRVGTDYHSIYALTERNGSYPLVMTATGGAVTDEFGAPGRWLLLAGLETSAAAIAPDFGNRSLLVFDADAAAVRSSVAPDLADGARGWFTDVSVATRPNDGLVVSAAIEDPAREDDADDSQPNVLIWISRVGQLDTNRGDGGYLLLPAGFSASDLMVDANSQTWISGRSAADGDTVPSPAVIRLNAAGRIDPEFGDAGQLVLPGSSLEPVLIGERKGGGAHIAFARPSVGDSGNQLTVTALAQSGESVQLYGSQGVATLGLGTATLTLRDLVELRTGGLRLLAGLTDATGDAALIGALDRRGNPVTGFGSTGVVSIPTPSGLPIQAHSMQIDDDGTLHVRAAIRASGTFGLDAQRSWVRKDGVLIDRKQRVLRAGTNAEVLWTNDEFTGIEWRHPVRFSLIDLTHEIAAGVASDDTNVMRVTRRALP